MATKENRARRREPIAGQFMQPQQPSPELASIVGNNPIPRSEVTKRVWNYIKSKGLQDKQNPRMIKTDEKLSSVLGEKPVSMFQMTQLVNKHLTPAPRSNGTHGNGNGKSKRQKPAAKDQVVEAIKAVVAPPIDRPAAEAFTPVQLYSDETNTPVRLLKPDECEPWPSLNPRTHFKPNAIPEMVASIKEVGGVLQPVLAHDRGEGHSPRYWIVVGETRMRAVRQIPGAVLPAVVRTFTLAQALRIALIENLQRNDLTAIEEARAFRRLLDEDPALTQEKLAAEIGMSQEYVANRVRLAELPEDVSALVDEGLVAPSVARDYLLPFIGIPEKPRKVLFAHVAKQVRSLVKSETATNARGHEILEFVSEKARELSKPVSQKDGVTPLMTAAQHNKECTCGAPRFRYSYTANEQRCFDETWWERTQARIRRDRKKEQETQSKGAKKAVKSAKSSGAMDYNKFYNKYGYNAVHSTLDKKLADVSKLEDAEFITVQPSHGDKKIQVFCTDQKKFAAAAKVVDDEREQLTAQFKSDQLSKDTDEARKLVIEPWMLREVLAIEELDHRELLEDFGIKVGGTWDASFKAIRKFSDDQATEVFKVLAIRAKRGEYAGRRWDRRENDPTATRVEDILEKKYGPARDALRNKIVKGKKDDAPKAKAKKGAAS